MKVKYVSKNMKIFSFPNFPLVAPRGAAAFRLPILMCQCAANLNRAALSAADIERKREEIESIETGTHRNVD